MKRSMYIYRVASDTGLAPCVDNGLLTLACCKGGWKNGVKTGIRYWVGNKKEVDYETEEVYLLGLYRGEVLYWAKVTKVVSMETYYSGMSKGRRDDIYNVIDGKLVHKKNVSVHNDLDQITRDISGKYVLISDEFGYYGNKYFGGEEIKDILMDNYPEKQTTKKLIHSDKVDKVLNYIRHNSNEINLKDIKPNNNNGICKTCH